MSTTRRFPFPYVPNTVLAIVDGTVQPVTDVEPDDPDGGTFELPEDPDDADVRAYARISPGVVPSPPVDEDDEPVDIDEEDDFEEDEDLADLEDDEAAESDPDAPAYPDDSE